MQTWSGKRAGGTVINYGDCAGTDLDIARARVLTTRRADANGAVTFRRNFNDAVCGRLFQVLDLGTCATSNYTLSAVPT